ncbi:UDP-2,3-diacylglucosamine diphosphatase [Teredinibacter turnerae]|uniref:UDP-2,3-diacylglucosamine diphosphatase n=1 Tax=Teredinibacter turnerae TaxID=2426 RepID=UPI000366F1F3|nr:UDP-2,3-diacylglucosamine diphosphatase [Teredinibacter turnerae]
MAIQYFISDLHLQPDRPDLVAAFYRFIDTYLQDADELYILGDFFDAWIGDDEDAPFYLDIAARLNLLSTQGVAIYFQHGNRDFLIGEQFAKSAGVTLLPEQHKTLLAGEPVLLMHGDSLCIDDTEYMAFRNQVRSAAWQQQVLALPLEQRRAMAAQLRSQSSSMNAMKAEDIMDVNPEAVAQAMRKFDVSTMLHGHTHRPAVHEIELNSHHGKRFVLGDWNTTGWFIRANASELQLVEFDF